MALPKQKIAARPEAEEKLSNMVRKLLREANALGVLPTPVDRLLEIVKVTSIEAIPDESFLASLPAQTRSIFKSAWQKVRGIADLRENVIYVAKDSRTGRALFAKCHELGHQTIPWHRFDVYLDTDETLRPDAKAMFEHQANYFGAETIFQVDRFRMMARDYRPTFDAIFTLADRHGASKQATAWRFVEDQDEALALLQYYPTGALDPQEQIVFNLWRSVGSPAFNRRIHGIDIPLQLTSAHPWHAAYQTNRICQGTDNLVVDGRATPFEWHGRAGHQSSLSRRKFCRGRRDGFRFPSNGGAGHRGRAAEVCALPSGAVARCGSRNSSRTAMPGRRGRRGVPPGRRARTTQTPAPGVPIRAEASEGRCSPRSGLRRP
jgi:Zn-dependent peptidase ImmA (M78 family)